MCELGLGCVALTKQKSLGSALSLLNRSYDLGVKHFDTAPLYGRGYSEMILGKFLRKKRADVHITTKVGLGNPPQASIPVGLALLINSLKQKGAKEKHMDHAWQPPNLLQYRVLDLEFVKASFFGSLKRLGTDYIDTYLLHEAMPSFLTEAALSFLLNQKEKGRIKSLGTACSFVNLTHADEKELEHFDVLQYEYLPKFGADEIIARFPLKKHVFHSLTRNFVSGLDYNAQMGTVISEATRKNPTGRILIGTSNKKHLECNVQYFHSYATY